MENDLVFLLLCARLSDTSYSDPSELSITKSPNICMIDGISFSYEFHETKGSQMYFFENQDYLFITIRGTAGKEDLDNLIEIGPERDEIIKKKVFEGFAEYADPLYPIIMKKLSQNKKRLVLTGHSLGAAAAKILSLKIDYSLTCVTFGEPKSIKARIKTPDFKKFIRIINHKDIVPRLPPFVYSYGVKDESVIYFSGEGHRIVNNPSALRMFVEEITIKIKAILGLPESIEDHFISSYIKSILKNLR